MGAYVPNLIGASIILLVGWLIAFVIQVMLRKILGRVGLNTRLSQLTSDEGEKKGVDFESGIAKGIFYLLMLFVLVAFFQTLGITLITEPLNQLLNSLFEFAPKLIGAAVLFLIAWVIASILKKLISKAMTASKFDERLGSSTGMKAEKQIPLTKSFSEAAYWLVFLLFLPAILGTLEMSGLLGPVETMMNKVLSFLPNIITAGIIFVVGWFVARIVRQVVTNLLAAAGLDAFTEKIGLSQALGEQKMSNVLGIFLFALIIIPVLIAALSTLGLDAITQPVSEVLNTLLSSLPQILGACIIVIVAYMIGKLLSGLITNLLTGIGFNSIMVMIGLQKEAPAEGKRTPSEIAGVLVLLAVMFFAGLEAFRMLGFESLAGLVNQFMVFASHILTGLIIFALGLYLSHIASRAILASSMVQAELLATASRIAIIIFSGAIALRQMGIANEIIVLAFGLMFGAVAVAFAIAFGIGGRDMASRKLEEWEKASKAE